MAWFPSKTGKSLDRPAVFLAMQAVAQRAGMEQAISLHWFSRATAPHALDNGCPVLRVLRAYSRNACRGAYLFVSDQVGADGADTAMPESRSHVSESRNAITHNVRFGIFPATRLLCQIHEHAIFV